MLLNQFHDILPGSSIARVYEEAAARYKHVLQETDSMVRKATSAVTSGEGRTWFNSLSWDRTILTKTQKGYGLVHIPSMGWTSTIDESAPAFPVTVSEANGCMTIQNGLISATVNHLGEITLLTDGRGNSRISGPANVLHMYKDVPRKFDAWDIDSMYSSQPVTLEGDSTVTLLEQSPYKCTLRVERHFSGSIWQQDISLCCNQSRLDFVTHVDWHEKHRLLKVAFPTGIHTEEGINEMQFGYVKRPTHRSRPYDADRFEVCNHRYTALCDENRGAAVLNDCKYGVSMLEDTISLTLLRAATAPDLHADEGSHDFRYSYYVWDGPMFSANVVREGYELNVPVTEAPGQVQTASMMGLDAPNIIVDTVKAADDGSGDIILRLYECKHADTSAHLNIAFPVRSACLCDMLENEKEPLDITEGTIPLHFHCFEVITLRLRLPVQS